MWCFNNDRQGDCSMRRFLPRLVPLLFLLLVMPAAVLAAGLSKLSVSPAAAGDDVLARVDWYHMGGSKYTLYLPSGWDPATLRLWLDGTDAVKIGDKEYRSGDQANCFTDGATVDLICGKKKYKVTVMQSANIPSVYIHTVSGSLASIHKSKNNRESGSILIMGADGTTVTEQEMTALRCRGHSSFQIKDKKSYQFKLSSGKNLFGMGKAKKWLLCATYRDKCMLRNQITFDMARYAGLQYTPELVHADVYINGEYRGVYLLCEKLEISSSRVDLDDLEEETQALNEQPLTAYPLLGSKKVVRGKGKYYAIPNDPPDITGGYLIEYKTMETNYKDQTSGYYTTRKNLLDFRSPKALSEGQYAYISSLLQSFENAIFAKDGIDPETGKHYTEIADLDSMVKKYMLEEICKNRDASKTSCYFYKPADAVSNKLYAGPAWDYDMGYASRCSWYEEKRGMLNPTGFWVNRDTRKGHSAWYPAMYAHADFQTAVKETWRSTYRHALSVLLGDEQDPTGNLRSLDEYADQIRQAMKLNLSRWPIVISSSYPGSYTTDYQGNINLMKKYLRERRAWLDSQWLDTAGK